MHIIYIAMPEILRVSHIYSISAGMHLGLICNIFLRRSRARARERESFIQTYRILLSRRVLSLAERGIPFSRASENLRRVAPWEDARKRDARAEKGTSKGGADSRRDCGDVESTFVKHGTRLTQVQAVSRS